MDHGYDPVLQNHPLHVVGLLTEGPLFLGISSILLYLSNPHFLSLKGEMCQYYFAIPNTFITCFYLMSHFRYSIS